ncbi:hypothetical protein KJ980_01810 [Patescibacteria group bacterium]|nr:hypothetical protein [Patescibacteria group bacterium]MBU4016603.1 hypothetical protein [Patescibacteria group bacterium]MBU4098364.1 hypothetical protein [Patescibacteria group bacterium]
MEQIVFNTSLIAAFVAGMVALFAPCCITFLLPSYLGSVFKEKEKVLLMTLVFGLGIFVVLLPAVLGVQLVSKALYRYHDIIYYIGGLVMLLAAVFALLNIKPPMPRLPGINPEKKIDVLSVFTLGIFSGITSACCAPVLIGVLSFAFLSPNFFGAMAIGGMYVLGMVTPLLIISLLISGKIPKFRFLRKRVTTITFFGKSIAVFFNNLIAAALFFATGLLTLILNAQGKFSMTKSDGFAKIIGSVGEYINQYVGNNIVLNIIFFTAIVYLLFRLIKKA